MIPISHIRKPRLRNEAPGLFMQLGSSGAKTQIQSFLRLEPRLLMCLLYAQAGKSHYPLQQTWCWPSLRGPHSPRAPRLPATLPGGATCWAVMPLAMACCTLSRVTCATTMLGKR